MYKIISKLSDCVPVEKLPPAPAVKVEESRIISKLSDCVPVEQPPVQAPIEQAPIVNEEPADADTDTESDDEDIPRHVEEKPFVAHKLTEDNGQYAGRKFGLIMTINESDYNEGKEVDLTKEDELLFGEDIQLALKMERSKHPFLNPAGLKLTLAEPNIENDVFQQFTFGKNEWNTIIDSFQQKGMEQFELTWKPLKDDSVFYLKGDSLRLDVIFYYGHTASFFINKLIISNVIEKRINPEMESIFAIGVDEMSWDDLNNKNYNWPKVSDVRIFRNKVKELVVNLIKTLPLQIPITWENRFWIIMMGIEHARIHLESSSVLIRQLPIDDLVPNRFGPIYDNQSRNLTDINELKNKLPQNELIPVKSGTVKLGKSFDDPFYGWDNEYGELIQEVKDFKASKYLVSNGWDNE